MLTKFNVAIWRHLVNMGFKVPTVKYVQGGRDLSTFTLNALKFSIIYHRIICKIIILFQIHLSSFKVYTYGTKHRFWFLSQHEFSYLLWRWVGLLWHWWPVLMMTLSNGNIFYVTGHLWGDSKGQWCFLWSAPEQTVEQTIETPVIWDAIALIMTSL